VTAAADEDVMTCASGVPPPRKVSTAVRPVSSGAMNAGRARPKVELWAMGLKRW